MRCRGGRGQRAEEDLNGFLVAGLPLPPNGRGGLLPVWATWVGHLTFCFLFRRPVLSALSELYPVVSEVARGRGRFVRVRGAAAQACYDALTLRVHGALLGAAVLLYVSLHVASSWR